MGARNQSNIRWTGHGWVEDKARTGCVGGVLDKPVRRARAAGRAAVEGPVLVVPGPGADLVLARLIGLRKQVRPGAPEVAMRKEV